MAPPSPTPLTPYSVTSAGVTEWAIRNARPVFFLTAVLCLVGAFLYSTFPVSILPDVAFPRVVIR